MSKVTLNNVASIQQNPTSAAGTINDNFSTVQTAFDNTLSLDGTSPNQMGANFDMNGNRILNLPTAVSTSEPVTLGTFNTVITQAGNMPAGGSTNQILSKKSNTDFDTQWVTGPSVAAGTNISATGSSPTTIATVANPNFATSVTTPSLVLNGTTVSAFTGSGSIVLANTPTLVTPNIGAASGTSLNLSGLVASSSIATDGSKNLISVNNTGSGNNVLGTSPTITTPNLVGTTTNDNASAGSVGEYVSSQVLVGSAVSLTTGVTANVTSISLTAGDWDVWGNVAFNPAGSTTMSNLGAWISTTSAAVPTNPNNGAETIIQTTFTTGATQTLPAGRTRLSLASTTTVFLEAFAAFGASTLGAYGFIGARRVR